MRKDHENVKTEPVRYLHGREEKLDTIFAGINSGLNAEQIELHVRTMHPENHTFNPQEEGVESEQRAQLVIITLDIVKRVIRSTHHEDHWGVDAWVFFYEESAHKKLPMQVKSSEGGIAKFIESGTFRQFERNSGRIIILNAGREKTDEEIKKSFLSQLETIDGYA